MKKLQIRRKKEKCRWRLMMVNRRRRQEKRVVSPNAHFAQKLIMVFGNATVFGSWIPREDQNGARKITVATVVCGLAIVHLNAGRKSHVAWTSVPDYIMSFSTLMKKKMLLGQELQN
ncbi:unnamed protein product [Orchesella dallaii]|uniref:Uncharacterized protein n=1 Tax=Orchesella dallaii TaxID=48710 RepID=A0ABP1RJN1_9HEXA